MEKINFKDYNIDDELLKSIDILGFLSPTKVQERVIPIALKNKDLVVKSQTGERVIIVTGCINALVSRVSGTFIKNKSCIA